MPSSSPASSRISHQASGDVTGGALPPVSHDPFAEAEPALSPCDAAAAAAPIFCRRRHQPRRPPHAITKPGSPAPAVGPGTLFMPPRLATA
jgi:hypothetical protein